MIVRNPYLFREIARHLPIFELEALGDNELTSPLFDEVKLEAFIHWIRKFSPLLSPSPNVSGLKTIIGIDLYGLQLTRLPTSIALLKSLRSLGLSRNRLISLPESIGRLVLLRVLDLSNNQLTILPESIGQLMELQKVGLYNNCLTRLPESLVTRKEIIIDDPELRCQNRKSL